VIMAGPQHGVGRHDGGWIDLHLGVDVYNASDSTRMRTRFSGRRFPGWWAGRQTTARFGAGAGDIPGQAIHDRRPN